MAWRHLNDDLVFRNHKISFLNSRVRRHLPSEEKREEKGRGKKGKGTTFARILLLTT
jgi:hypothetical protein